MLNIGDKVIIDDLRSLGDVVTGIVYKIDTDGEVYYKYGEKLQYKGSGYSVCGLGGKIASLLNVKQRYVFRLNVENAPLYYCDRLHVYEYVNNVWRVADHYITDTALFKLAKMKKENVTIDNTLRHLVPPIRMACGWMVGDIVKGLFDNGYSHTNHRFKGIIVDIIDCKRNEFKVRTLEHESGDGIGLYNNVIATRSNGEYRFERVGHDETLL